MQIPTIFTTYLIYPIVTLLLIAVMVLIAKKNKLLKNKRLITYTLLSILLLAVPSLLGFLDYNFMPYAYLALTAAYLLAGFYNDRLLPWAFGDPDIKYRAKIGLTLFQALTSMLLFALVFNLCNELKFGLWAAMSILPFVLVSFLVQSYRLFMQIPLPIYKVWAYEKAKGYSAPEDIDHSRLKVVSVELFKHEGDTAPIRINAKVPDEMLLGDWIKLLFEDYNRKSPHSPITTHDRENSGWIFYTKTWLLAPRRYLDCDLTVRDNRIREKHLIIAKRVEQIIEE